MNKLAKFSIAVGIQFLIVIGIIVFKLLILAGGNEVLLHIEPVDPRDPLRGDYMTFQYNISQLDSYQFNYRPVRNGDTVYVPLKTDGIYSRADYDQVSNVKPTSGVFIKGQVVSGGEEEEKVLNSTKMPSTGFNADYRKVSIKYGIEDYFIPENSGLNFPQTNNAYAKVAIDDNGNAVLKSILIDNKPWP